MAVKRQVVYYIVVKNKIWCDYIVSCMELIYTLLND